MDRICVQWPRLGPYHLARLRAASGFFGERGVSVVALETASQDATYAWREERGAESFQRETVFPDHVFEEIAPREMRAGVTAALDRLAPDAVAITSYSKPDARACLAWCRRHGRAAVLMMASKQDDAERVWWREQIKARLVRQYDAALTSGTPQRRYLEALGMTPARIFAGYGAVDNAFFREGARVVRHNPEQTHQQIGLEDTGAPFFLASNRFVERKNLDGLLRAYHEYRRAANAPWPLVLLGDGPLRGSLERQAAAEKIGGVTFAGFRQYDELPAFYGRAGAFVHPALQDQWGLVVNEAMAAGLPVLVSEAAGCAEDLIEEGANGYVFDPCDEAQLADVLGHVAALPEAKRQAMGARAQEIIARWSPEQFARQLWEAARAGRPHAQRSLDLTARLVLWGLRLAARSTQSFHHIRK